MPTIKTCEKQQIITTLDLKNKKLTETLYEIHNENERMEKLIKETIIQNVTGEIKMTEIKNELKKSKDEFRRQYTDSITLQHQNARRIRKEGKTPTKKYIKSSYIIYFFIL